MEERNTEITLAVEGTVTITTSEYRELIACQAMLDMLLISAKRDSTSLGYPDQALVKMVAIQRSRYLDPADTPEESGEIDA